MTSVFGRVLIWLGEDWSFFNVKMYAAGSELGVFDIPHFVSLLFSYMA